MSGLLGCSESGMFSLSHLYRTFNFLKVFHSVDSVFLQQSRKTRHSRVVAYSFREAAARRQELFLSVGQASVVRCGTRICISCLNSGAVKCFHFSPGFRSCFQFHDWSGVLNPWAINSSIKKSGNT